MVYEGKVYLSCGHTEDYYDSNGVELRLKDYTKEGDNCVKSGVYCMACCSSILANRDTVIFFQEEEDEWLDNERVYGFL